jgi:hypothetical protein
LRQALPPKSSNNIWRFIRSLSATWRTNSFGVAVKYVFYHKDYENNDFLKNPHPI